MAGAPRQHVCRGRPLPREQYLTDVSN